MDWDALHQICKTSFAFETPHEGWELNRTQCVHRYPTRHVNPACCQKLHRDIARLARQDRNKEFDGCRTQLAASGRIDALIDDHERGIACGRDKRSDFGIFGHCFHVTKVSVDIWDPNSRTDVLEAHMIELLEHILEQADLPRVRRRKVGMTALRTVCQIPRSIPRKKRLTQPGTRRNDGNGSLGNRYAGINCLDVAWPEDWNCTGNGFEVIDETN